MPLKRRIPGGFALLFVGFWTLITLIFDGVIGYGVVRQMAAASYSTAPGVITASQRVMSAGSGQGSNRSGPTWSAQISFRYSVAGRDYTSDRWRYGQWGSSSSSAAADVVARYPVGAKVNVLYNPRDPGDAVLVAGVQGMDTFLLLFMTPFNAVMLGGWVVLAGGLGVGPYSPRPLGVPVWEAGGETRVRLLGMFPPSMAAIGAAGIAGFVSIFVVGFGWGMGPPVSVAGGVWGGCVGAGLVVYAVLRGRLAAGRRDLRIDPVRRLLILPPSAVGRGQAEVAFASVTRVVVAPGSATTNGKLSSWRVKLRIGADSKVITLVEQGRKDEMKALAAWLAGIIGVSSGSAAREDGAD